MSKSELEIYNLALGACGVRERLSSVQEKSKAAEICRLHFTPNFEYLLGTAHWSSAKTSEQLPLKAARDGTTSWQPNDPLPPWGFAYGLPRNYIYPRNLINGERFEMGIHQNAPALFTNTDKAHLIYTSKPAIENLDAQLYAALIYSIAYSLAMPLTGKKQTMQLMQQSVSNIVTQVQVTNANQEHVPVDYIPDWLAARGVTHNTSTSGYVYPYAPILTLFQGTTHGG